MPKLKNLRDIKDELLSAFIALEESYYNASGISIDPEKRIAYLQIQLCEHLLNSLKSLEYHYRDDVPETRTVKRQPPELVKANQLIKKYGENVDPGRIYSKLQLQPKFDNTGYLENRSFLEEVAEKRLPLKKNFKK